MCEKRTGRIYAKLNLARYLHGRGRAASNAVGRRSLRLHFGPQWTVPAEAPFSFSEPHVKALSVRPSQLPQVSGDSRKGGGRCKEKRAPKTKAANFTVGGVEGEAEGDSRDKSTKGRNNHTSSCVY